MSIAARHTSNPRAPEERNVVLWHTPEPVGVGCPNPSGEATPLLRLRNASVTSYSIPPLAPAGRHVW